MRKVVAVKAVTLLLLSIMLAFSLWECQRFFTDMVSRIPSGWKQAVKALCEGFERNDPS